MKPLPSLIFPLAVISGIAFLLAEPLRSDEVPGPGPAVGMGKGGKGGGKGKGKGNGVVMTRPVSREIAKPPPVPENGSPSPAVDPTVGFTTTITGIDGDRVTYRKPFAEAAPAVGGKGKGKGRFGKGVQTGPEETRIVSDKLLVTSATSTRRTGDLIIGIEMGGGLRNDAFADVAGSGVPARIVIKDDRIVEINVLVSQEENDAPIAVKPKRPPSK